MSLDEDIITIPGKTQRTRWRDLAEAIGIDMNRHVQFTVEDVIDEARRLYDRNATLQARVAKLKGDIEQLKNG